MTSAAESPNPELVARNFSNVVVPQPDGPAMTPNGILRVTNDSTPASTIRRSVEA